MYTSEQIAALQHEHHTLEQQLEQEGQRPAPDSVLMRELKKAKLRLKDQLEQLRQWQSEQIP